MPKDSIGAFGFESVGDSETVGGTCLLLMELSQSSISVSRAGEDEASFFLTTFGEFLIIKLIFFRSGSNENLGFTLLRGVAE